MAEPNLYKVGLEGRLFGTKVFWSWQLYAIAQAAVILFIGMVFTQMTAVEDGRNYTFWAGGHVVYFECVLTVNIVLLRGSHNWTGWGELLIFLQVASFFVFVYIDSIMLTYGEIAYFFDEYCSSWTAWLGCFFIGCLLFIEKNVLDAWKLWNGSNSAGRISCDSDEQGKHYVSL